MRRALGIIDQIPVIIRSDLEGGRPRFLRTAYLGNHERIYIYMYIYIYIHQKNQMEMCFKQIHQLFLCLSGSSFSFDIVSWLGISALFVPPNETISCFPALLQPWTMAAIWPSVAPKFDQGLCDLMIFSPISRKPELELLACIARGTQDGMIALSAMAR